MGFVVSVVAALGSWLSSGADPGVWVWEDSAPVWVCSVQGNRECAPDWRVAAVKYVTFNYGRAESE